jgi:hypothetical protein
MKFPSWDKSTFYIAIPIDIARDESTAFLGCLSSARLNRVIDLCVYSKICQNLVSYVAYY